MNDFPQTERFVAAYNCAIEHADDLLAEAALQSDPGAQQSLLADAALMLDTAETFRWHGRRAGGWMDPVQ